MVARNGRRDLLANDGNGPVQCLRCSGGTRVQAEAAGISSALKVHGPLRVDVHGGVVVLGRVGWVEIKVPGCGHGAESTASKKGGKTSARARGEPSRRWRREGDASIPGRKGGGVPGRAGKRKRSLGGATEGRQPVDTEGVGSSFDTHAAIGGRQVQTNPLTVEQALPSKSNSKSEKKK